MIKKIRNLAVYNDVRIELSNESIKVIYRDTIKTLREIMDRLGIFYRKMENPQSLSHHLISHITGNSNFSRMLIFPLSMMSFLLKK